MTKTNHGHPVYSLHQCIDAYEDPPQDEDWQSCPHCGLRPKVWLYSNGRSTACGCGHSKYHHFAVCAESVMSCYTRCGGSLAEYDCDALRKNWNEYCATMINPCDLNDLLLLGRW